MTAHRLWICIIPIIIGLNPSSVFSGNKQIFVGFDGAYGVKQATSALAIERGLEIAIDEVNQAGGVLGGRKFKLITANNRSVPARGIANLRKFADTKELVAVFAGRFSPVILQQLKTAHELKMPLLDVWGAADGVTEHNYKPNYVFRLSLKDEWAMPVMLNHAKSLGAKRIGVLLPNTGWGRSNQHAFQQALSTSNTIRFSKPIWYNWGEKDMLQYYREFQRNEVEAIILVANDIEGAILISQLKDIAPEHRVPIISHWGVTGGEMVEASGPILHEINFSVVQTFSFFKAEKEVLSTFMKTAEKLYGTRTIEELISPVGFGHAYDMMHILAKAVEMAGSTDRSKIRKALEQVRNHHGLIKFYAKPFTAERHDALSSDQVFMARYRRDGVIVPIP